MKRRAIDDAASDADTDEDAGDDEDGRRGRCDERRGRRDRSRERLIPLDARSLTGRIAKLVGIDVSQFDEGFQINYDNEADQLGPPPPSLVEKKILEPIILYCELGSYAPLVPTKALR